MLVNGNPVWASGSIVICPGEVASFDMPGAQATLNFVDDGGAPAVAVEATQAIIHLRNFDSTAGVWAATSFVGAPGIPEAGKTIYLTFANTALGSAPNFARIIHFTVVVQ